jgi:hypothetical protein
MATLADIPIVDPNVNDPLVAYTVSESALKISQISTILSQRLGPNWKTVLVYIVFFLLGVGGLIVYSLNSDNPTYNQIISHIKAGLLSIILSGIIVVVWLSLKPYHDNTLYGVVPYPLNREFIPPDSSQCGRSPTICDPDSPQDKGCDVLCVNNQRSNTNDHSGVKSSGGKHVSNNYECTAPNHPNVYYLGTHLDQKTHYCLPKQAAATIGACDKDNGRVVWTLNPDGTQGWECQCLYPDLFGGANCSDQLVCGTSIQKDGLVDNLASGLTSESSKYGQRTYYNHKDSDPTKPSIYLSTWRGQNPPSGGILAPTSPYDMMTDPRDVGKKIPRFQCACPVGWSVLDGDPFVCHQDICLNGGSFGESSSSPVAFFDENKQKCVCSGNRMIKSNVNGACYPISEDNCNPHLETGVCTYGWGIILSRGTQIVSGDTALPALTADTPLLIIANVIDNMIYANISDGKVLPPPPGLNIKKRYLCGAYYKYEGIDQQCFVDVTDTVGTNQSKFYDLTSLADENKNVLFWIHDILQAYPIKQGVPVSSLENVRGTDLAFINTITSKAGGVSKNCDSFYFKRSNNIITYPKCQDPLSKSGSEFYELCEDNNLCNPMGTCQVDLSRNSTSGGRGHFCSCKSGTTFNGINCGGCLNSGDNVPIINDIKATNIVWNDPVYISYGGPPVVSNPYTYDDPRCCNKRAKNAGDGTAYAVCQ